MGPVAAVAGGAAKALAAPVIGAVKGLVGGFGGGGGGGYSHPQQAAPQPVAQMPQAQGMSNEQQALMVMKLFGQLLRRAEYMAADVEDAEKMQLFIETVGYENAVTVFESEGAREIMGDVEFPVDSDNLANFYEQLTPEQGQQLSAMLDQRMNEMEVPQQ